MNNLLRAHLLFNSVSIRSGSFFSFYYDFTGLWAKVKYDS